MRKSWPWSGRGGQQVRPEVSRTPQRPASLSGSQQHACISQNGSWRWVPKARGGGGGGAVLVPDFAEGKNRRSREISFVLNFWPQTGGGGGPPTEEAQVPERVLEFFSHAAALPRPSRLSFSGPHIPPRPGPWGTSGLQTLPRTCKWGRRLAPMHLGSRSQKDLREVTVSGTATPQCCASPNRSPGPESPLQFQL